ncbi:hypothetical protein [Desulfosediminicola flagellatus]|uniref:hypothetical protein n=1 Tax=Desulfosediminicola flagellatus TaxID=2569541 RepID=UPI0010AC8B77|nr:hypothetical protein [Desulfosediminicola flagellatus]
MANNNVFRGSDASLTLSPQVSESEDGKTAAHYCEAYLKDQPVGRATGITLVVRTELREFHEIGKRHAAQLRPGNIHISGTIEKASVDGFLLKSLLGKGADSKREKEPYPCPVFNLTMDLNDSVSPDGVFKVTVNDLRFESWAFDLPEDDFVMENATFRALSLSVEDGV